MTSELSPFQSVFCRSLLLFAPAMLLAPGCAGSDGRSSDAPAIHAAVARHLATEAVPRLGPEVPYCLGLGSMAADSVPVDPDGALIEALRAEGLEVQPVSTCELPYRSGRVSDRSTGDRRGLLLISSGERGVEGDARVDAFYYFGRTAAVLWRCAVHNRDGAWAVRQCEMVSEA